MVFLEGGLRKELELEEGDPTAFENDTISVLPLVINRMALSKAQVEPALCIPNGAELGLRSGCWGRRTPWIWVRV